jgi:hypothetical protein
MYRSFLVMRECFVRIVSKSRAIWGVDDNRRAHFDQERAEMAPAFVCFSVGTTPVFFLFFQKPLKSWGPWHCEILARMMLTLVIVNGEAGALGRERDFQGPPTKTAERGRAAVEEGVKKGPLEGGFLFLCLKRIILEHVVQFRRQREVHVLLG